MKCVFVNWFLVFIQLPSHETVRGRSQFKFTVLGGLVGGQKPGKFVNVYSTGIENEGR